MMKQKDATISTVLNVLADRGVVYEMNGPVILKTIFSPDDRTKAIDELCAMYTRGEYEITTKPSEAELRKYVSGLLTNWVSKYDGFNSGVKHAIKNPGSKAGQGNATVKALRAMLESDKYESARADIQVALDLELAKTRVKTEAKIDASFLPESLRHLVTE